MRFDMSQMAGQDRYKILASSIVPRPIAWIVSMSADGVRNAAPFSFFNMMGSNPPTVALGFLAKEGGLKDTVANILATGELVINLVDEDNAEAMNLTCIDAPAGVDETVLAGLELLPSETVAPPRIASAPVSMECKLLTSVETGPHQVIVIAEINIVHIRDEFVIDAARCYIDTTRLGLVARSHGSGQYLRSGNYFQLTRPVWSDYAEGKALDDCL